MFFLQFHEHDPGDPHGLELGDNSFVQFEPGLYFENDLDQVSVRGNADAVNLANGNTPVFNRGITVQALDGFIEKGNVKLAFFEIVGHAQPDDHKDDHDKTGDDKKAHRKFCFYRSHITSNSRLIYG